MLLGRISRLYFVILVVWLVKKARLEESFKLFRGKYDVFSNEEFSQTDDEDRAYDDEFDSSDSYDDCSKYGANCKDMACCYCICNRSNNGYTYMRNRERCVRDEELLPKAGCYHFADGSFLRFLSYDELCKQNVTCGHKVYIPAPSFAENAECSIKLKKSTYMRHGKTMKFVRDDVDYFDLEATNEGNVKNDAVKKWNGSLMKLNIKCKQGAENKKDTYCVLLKFETLPKYSKTITGFPTSKSDISSGSSTSKVVAIAVPIVLLIVMVCVAVGMCVIYRRSRRRRGGQPEIGTNEEELQSRESQNSPNNLSEDPLQMNEQLEEDRRESGYEHLYQNVVELDHQDKDTSAYDYIDEKGATNPDIDGEYSYASIENLAAQQLLPSAPAVYQTLEEPDGSDNPTFEHDKLSDNKGHDPKNEPFNKQYNNPVYQTLEEQEHVQNPNSKLDDESTDKSLHSIAKESLERQTQNPVYQTLEGQEARQNPNSKLKDESTDKNFNSVAKESLETKDHNPVYQTLENPNGDQDTSSETFGSSSVRGMAAGESVYHVLDSP